MYCAPADGNGKEVSAKKTRGNFKRLIGLARPERGRIACMYAII